MFWQAEKGYNGNNGQAGGTRCLKVSYIKDVTGEYFGENSVEVEIDETECGQYAYLGVFSFPGWKAIDMALHQNGKAKYEKYRAWCHLCTFGF